MRIPEPVRELRPHITFKILEKLTDWLWGLGGGAVISGVVWFVSRLRSHTDYVVIVGSFVIGSGLMYASMKLRRAQAAGPVSQDCVANYDLEPRQRSPVLPFRQTPNIEPGVAGNLETWGVVAVYNMQDSKEKNQRNSDTVGIISGGSWFCLSGSTGASYIDPSVHLHWEHVKKKLDEGSSFKLLLTQPFCEAKRMRNRLNNIDTAIDPKLNLMVINQVRQRYPHFEVRFTNEVYCSVFFSERQMMYDPYHLGQVNDRLENHFMAFRIEDKQTQSGVNYFTQLKRHFDNAWGVGIEFETFVTDHKSQLRGHILLKEVK
jgi:hypothetical protein